MAVTITASELGSALRLGDTPEETAESVRLLHFATAAVERHLGAAFDTTPDAIASEACIRLAAYNADQPNAGRGASFADAMRNSGALSILAPYRVHRAGSTSEEAVAASSPTGDGADQVARDAAAQAQADADAAGTTAAAAQASADTAQSAADAAQTTADVPGLRETGSEAVTVATAREWVSTAIPFPAGDIFGVQVDDEPIALALAADLSDPGVTAGGDASGAIGMHPYAIAAATAGGVLFFASTTAGTFTVRVFVHA